MSDFQRFDTNSWAKGAHLICATFPKDLCHNKRIHPENTVKTETGKYPNYPELLQVRPAFTISLRLSQ